MHFIIKIFKTKTKLYPIKRKVENKLILFF